MKAQSLIALAAAAGCTSLARAQTPHYRVTLIPSLPNSTGVPQVPQAINDLGWVVGSVEVGAAGYGYHVFLWKAGQPPQDIGTPPGFPLLLPTDINNSGLILGTLATDINTISTQPRPFSWTNGQFTIYNQLVGGRPATPGLTNDAGRIIGWANDGSFIGNKAVEYFADGSVAELMPAVEGYNTAIDINNVGVILGTEIRGAYLWFPQQPERFILPPPAVDFGATVVSMNDLSDIAGSARQVGHAESTSAAVYFYDQGWRFPSPGGRRNTAVAINNRREVVGNSQDNTGALGNHGWYWTAQTGTLPLQDLIIDPPATYGVLFVRDINQNGQIVGVVMNRATGTTHGAMLTPIEAPCDANCDGSTTIPILTANDFQCFLNLFAAGAPSANCDGSTISPFLNANDFQCFLNHFAAGCS